MPCNMFLSEFIYLSEAEKGKTVYQRELLVNNSYESNFQASAKASEYAVIILKEKNVTVFYTFVTICNFFRFSQRNFHFLTKTDKAQLVIEYQFGN